MEPRARKAVSTFLQTFILVAVAVGASSMVYEAANNYASAAQGPSVAVSDVTIRQGSNVAVERMVIANTGTVAFSTFTILNVGIASGQFYIILTNPATGAPVTASPASGAAPSSITETATIPPGLSVLASVTIASANEFALGARYSVVVSTSAAAQQQVLVVAVPA